MIKTVLTTHEMAKYCNVAPRTVIQWVNEGKIKSYKTPGNHNRVELSEFLRFLQEYNMPIPKELDNFDKLNNNKKILIVDDDKNIARAINRVLTLKGEYDLEIAFDGFDAGRKITMFEPDLVILDIKMPGMDGYAVADRIRSDEQTTNIKILAISAFFDDESKARIVSCGADAHLDKPFSQEDLLEKIEELLQN
ncbi:MAG: response regulator [Candidatus Zapsychrus exili]|nr:response regulator [Candidatus Zapsychrus exili]